MSAPSYDEVKSLFMDLQGLPREERTARLAEVPADVRSEVEAMLDANSALDDGFMEPVLNVHEAMQGDRLLGEVIGAFQVERVIGEGGMGRVYAASRADGAFEQEVALKVVKRGMDTDAVLRRFEAERRILARLRHPGIARLIDGGETTDGRPYVAMELVDGEPITQYADRFSLGVEDRVRLLAQVCDAVAHAHQRGVVHRDLKPSNVLVEADEEGRPSVKLLDFGIARVLEGDPEDALTVTGQFPMTRPYAAPEQFRGEEVTTATDVWALGVLLYELLTGQRPFRAASRAELESAILDNDPTLPSASTRGETTTNTDIRRLRGDLDAVCLTALAKEPERRYPSADALAADLRRYLRDLPVEARPPAAGYRIRKFIARHQAAVGVATVALAVLIAGASVYTVRLQAERDRAEDALAEADATATFLEDIFAAADPTGADPADRSARDLLALGLEQARADLADQPRQLAPVLATLGRVHVSLGLYEPARGALTDAIRLYESERLDPLGHRDALLQLANLSYRTDDYEVAVRHARTALDLHEQHASPDSVGDRLEIVNTLAVAYSDLDSLDLAARLMQEVVDGRRALPGEDAEVDLSINLNNLGLVLYNLERYDDALPHLDEAVALTQKTRGPDHPYVAFALHGRAGVHAKLGNGAQALADERRAVAIGEAAFGPDHPFTQQARSSLDELEAMGGDATDA
ncbi:MAG: serine/threonine-protein kinase [Bacteroidota bacterium]